MTRNTLRASAAIFALYFATLLQANAFQWQVVQHEGRDYLPAENIHEFYRFHRWAADGKSIWFRSSKLLVKGEVGSNELFINNIKFILSYPAVRISDKVYFSRIDLCKLFDPVLRPHYIQRAQVFDTVVIDAGHGGHDSGAVKNGLVEKNLTLDVAKRLERDLTALGFKTRLTRSTDVFLSLGERARVASQTPNSIFISVHFNSGRAGAHGIETFALSPQGSSSSFAGESSKDERSYNGNMRDSENIALATAVHAQVMHSIGAEDRGIKRARWAVLTNVDKPGILFEGGFITNPTEAQTIATTAYRDKLSDAISKAVVRYRDALSSQVASRNAASGRTDG